MLSATSGYYGVRGRSPTPTSVSEMMNPPLVRQPLGMDPRLLRAQLYPWLKGVGAGASPPMGGAGGAVMEEDDGGMEMPPPPQDRARAGMPTANDPYASTGKSYSNGRRFRPSTSALSRFARGTGSQPVPHGQPFIAGDAQEDGEPNEELILPTPEGIEVLPLKDLPRKAQGTRPSTPHVPRTPLPSPKPPSGLDHFYRMNPKTPNAAQKEAEKLILNPDLPLPIRIPKLAHGTVDTKPDTKTPVSKAGRTSGLSKRYSNQNNLTMERTVRGGIDPLTGISHTPTEREIADLLAAVSQSQDAQFPGYDNAARLAMLAQYYQAKRSQDPVKLEQAAQRLSEFKNRLNALRAQAEQVPDASTTAPEGSFQPPTAPVVAPEAAPVAPQPAPSQALQPSLLATRERGADDVLRPVQPQNVSMRAPAPPNLGRTASFSAPSLSPGVLSRDSEGNANLGTGNIYNTGGSKRALASKYGGGSSFMPTRRDRINPSPQAPPAPAPEPEMITETIEEPMLRPTTKQLAHSPFYNYRPQPQPGISPIERAAEGIETAQGIGTALASGAKLLAQKANPSNIGRSVRRWAVTPR